MSEKSTVPALIKKHEMDVREHWIREQVTSVTLRADLMEEEELRHQSKEFLSLLQETLEKSDMTDIMGPEWAQIRELLSHISRSRARQGFSPSETATFVFSLKQPLFTMLQKEYHDEPKSLADELWIISVLIDKLGLFIIEEYIKGREEVIQRQQQEMLELSTPVVKIWDGILTLPLIGTLDSERTQIVMESLLQRIVETNSSIAIIDITGVPTVDTLVAQHLLKTAAAARLMGAECIISGIRPQIAQTMVHLGIMFSEITTRATLADALKLAFKLLEINVARA